MKKDKGIYPKYREYIIIEECQSLKKKAESREKFWQESELGNDRIFYTISRLYYSLLELFFSAIAL